MLKKKNEFNKDQPVICSFPSKFHILLKKKLFFGFLCIRLYSEYFFPLKKYLDL